jgi:hypothetical protein
LDVKGVLSVANRLQQQNATGMPVILESLRYLQSVRDHSVEQLWNIVLFDEERRTKPLRMILQMLANPFTCPLGEWPNERKRSLRQDPDVGFAGWAVHCLPSVFANGGSGLIGNSGRKTANVCDKHARETNRNIATHFTALGFIILLRKSPGKVLKMFRKRRLRAIGAGRCHSAV